MHIYKVANDSSLRIYVSIHPSICVSICIVSDFALFHWRLANRWWLPRQFGRAIVLVTLIVALCGTCFFACCAETVVSWKCHNGKSKIQRSSAEAFRLLRPAGLLIKTRGIWPINEPVCVQHTKNLLKVRLILFCVSQSSFRKGSLCSMSVRRHCPFAAVNVLVRNFLPSERIFILCGSWLIDLFFVESLVCTRKTAENFRGDVKIYLRMGKKIVKFSSSRWNVSMIFRVYFILTDLCILVISKSNVLERLFFYLIFNFLHRYWNYSSSFIRCNLFEEWTWRSTSLIRINHVRVALWLSVNYLVFNVYFLF